MMRAPHNPISTGEDSLKKNAEPFAASAGAPDTTITKPSHLEPLLGATPGTFDVSHATSVGPTVASSRESALPPLLTNAQAETASPIASSAVFDVATADLVAAKRTTRLVSPLRLPSWAPTPILLMAIVMGLLIALLGMALLHRRVRQRMNLSKLVVAGSDQLPCHIA